MKNPLRFRRWTCPSSNDKMVARSISDVLVDVISSNRKEGIIHVDTQGNEQMIEIFIHIEKEGSSNGYGNTD